MLHICKDNPVKCISIHFSHRGKLKGMQSSTPSNASKKILDFWYISPFYKLLCPVNPNFFL